MPRALHIINRLSLGGLAYNAAYLTHDLAPEFETSLVTGREEDHEASLSFIAEQLGIQPMFVGAMRRSISPGPDLRAYRNLLALIRDYAPDIVHTHGSKPGILGRLAARRAGVPVIVHTFHGHLFHSYFGPVQTRGVRAAEQMLARLSSAIVAISPAQKVDLVERFRIAPPDKVHVVPLGIDTAVFRGDRAARRARFRARWGISEDEVVVGLVGRMVPIKNHTLFLKAWADVLRRTGRPCRAVLVGDGPERPELERQARALDLDGPRGVIFTSWITEIEDVQAGLDIGALTSHNEGTPVSLIEAQASARPVVATRVGGVPDVMRDGETGFMTPPGDATAFATSVTRLIDDDALREQLGRRGEVFARENYDRVPRAGDMAALYRSLLTAARRGDS